MSSCLNMLPLVARSKIKKLAQAGRVRVSSHALYDRFGKHDVTYQDVVHALAWATGCEATYHDRWEVTGPSLDKVTLFVVVAIEDDVVVVTVRRK